MKLSNAFGEKKITATKVEFFYIIRSFCDIIHDHFVLPTFTFIIFIVHVSDTYFLQMVFRSTHNASDSFNRQAISVKHLQVRA